MKSMVRGELEQKIQDFDRAQAACGTATGEGECRTVRYERSAATESRTDSTQLYLSEIGYKPMLTAEQEVHYARQARAGHEDGRKRMVEGNLRLVVKSPPTIAGADFLFRTSSRKAISDYCTRSRNLILKGGFGFPPMQPGGFARISSEG